MTGSSQPFHWTRYRALARAMRAGECRRQVPEDGRQPSIQNACADQKPPARVARRGPRLLSGTAGS
jgi:hypothetical protein